MKCVTNWLLGTVRITVVGAELQRCLNKLAQRKIPFWNLTWSDEFTASFTVPYAMHEQVLKTVSLSMCQIRNTELYGLPVAAKKTRRRVLLPLLILFSIAAAILFTKYIWFFEVQGNENVPAEKIIRQVQKNGVTYGTKGKDINSYEIENRVLSQLRELSFLTVNQSGAKAVIVVREKEPKSDVNNRRNYRHIVADKGGLITDVSVMEGAALAHVGDTVTEGQILISGFVDLEHSYRLCEAIGEVYARTWYTPKLVVPAQCEEKSKIQKEKTVFYLCFGQKRIKISGGSRIFPSSCDKITKTAQFALPGGFLLPISLVRETYCFYTPEPARLDKDGAEEMLAGSAREMITWKMIAGKILKQELRLHEDGDSFVLSGLVECEEMIGRAVPAEIFKGEIIHDGTSN